jgi:hypothetical protein
VHMHFRNLGFIANNTSGATLGKAVLLR